MSTFEDILSLTGTTQLVVILITSGAASDGKFILFQWLYQPNRLKYYFMILAIRTIDLLLPQLMRVGSAYVWLLSFILPTFNGMYFSMLYGPLDCFTSHVGEAAGVWNRLMVPAHGDVMAWKRYPQYWLLVRGIHRWPIDSLHKGR